MTSLRFKVGQTMHTGSNRWFVRDTQSLRWTHQGRTHAEALRIAAALNKVIGSG